MARLKKLLFIDTNIWLDFYRGRNDAALSLLKHVEAVADRVIVTYQLEQEFKKNRQNAILEGMQELKAPTQIARPGIFSDAKASRALNKSLKSAEKRVKALKSRLEKALADPARHDPVYKACQRIFHRLSKLVLTRENPIRRSIRRRAVRRFLHGCPPRKRGDTSVGDAINWEWMVECAKTNNAELVIVTRDSDYGAVFEGKAYVNDHLRQEFSERVSKKRKLLVYTRLSDALKHFQVDISPQEEAAELELVQVSGKSASPQSVLSSDESLNRVTFRLPIGSGRALLEKLLGAQVPGQEREEPDLGRWKWLTVHE